MEAKTLAEAKADLERLMDEAVENHEPVIITREGKPPVALISLHDLRGEQETAFLNRSHTNRERLLRSIASANNGVYAKEMTVEELERILKAAR
jgi:antitoxin YefM